MFIKRGIFICLLLMCVGIAQAATSDRVLKKNDIQTYKNIFLNQKKSQFKTARQSEKKLTNKLLLGYVLFGTMSFRMNAILIGSIILVMCIIGMRISINNKQDYIDAIRSQKAVCDGQLETVKQDYRKLIEELEKLKGDE